MKDIDKPCTFGQAIAVLLLLGSIVASFAIIIMAEGATTFTGFYVAVFIILLVSFPSALYLCKTEKEEYEDTHI